MSLTRISAPVASMFTLEELRAHVRLDACGSPPEHPDDTLLLALADRALSELDGADGWLGRALINQTWRLTLDRFPAGRIYLPLTSPQAHDASPAPAPVLSVTYTDTDGVVRTLTEGTDYVVLTEHDPQFIEPAYNVCWPSTRCISGAVRVTYQAGYGDAAEDVPAAIRSYVLVRIGQLYEFRELVVAGVTVAEVPYLRDSLENFRLRGYF